MAVEQLSRREREILDILYAKEEATAAEVRLAMTGDPSDATVRTLLRILGEKGVVKYKRQGRHYRYRPVQLKKRAAKQAFRHVLNVFFGGSVEAALASHLSDPKTQFDQDELNRLRELISEAERGETT
ncbi:BlaI/MecI/CopY family transcriptional regulator [Stieleria sp. ICT_E10.1]|uniref:BlaI/MecI/CopY family transcriptional regulator n=1 Tax=Stieleria sedimenti TaxID=2976331 RepID=UPI0021806634|nr:BlaI/MecI/CopY family transcriptional regulator [Stieleria sedimenti]MCS7469903.1 BlaI/MecI/CopY family transcriptional regulator [Stieleria sedimenti]